MEHVLKQIITTTFENEVGRHQRKVVKGELGNAMLVTFWLRVDYERWKTYVWIPITWIHAS